MLPKDYVRLRLTGESAIDVADASGTLLLDVAHRIWSSEVLEQNRHRQQTTCRSFSNRRKFAANFRKPAQTQPVFAPALPSLPGRATKPLAPWAWASRAPAWSAPRSELPAWFSPQPTNPRSIPKADCIRSATPFPGRWHVMGVTQAAGLSLRWFRDRFGAGPDDGRDPYERLSAEAATVPAGSEGASGRPI